MDDADHDQIAQETQKNTVANQMRSISHEMRNRSFFERVSKPLTSETELIWKDRQYLKNKRQFGQNKIAGWNGSFGFDRDCQDRTLKNYTRNFRE
jgi:hypothetical protein